MEALLTLVEKTALLKSFPVLASVPTEALAQLAARTRELHFDAGDVVVREGEPNRGSFLVVEGRIEVRKGGGLVRLITQGVGFGQLELGEGEPHTYSLIALEHTHVINFTPEDVVEAVLDFPEVGLALVRLLSERIHELNDRVLALERVVGELADALSKAGVEPPVALDGPSGAGAPADSRAPSGQ